MASWRSLTSTPGRTSCIKPFDINNASYQPVTTDAFIPARPNIFVRVVLIGNNVSQVARVDDLTVQCVS